MHAVGAPDRDHLSHQIQQQRTRLWVLADRPDREAHGRRGRRQPDEEYELLPYRTSDVGADLRIDPARQRRRVKRLNAVGPPPVELAHDQPLQRPCAANDPRLGDGSSDVRDAADELRIVVSRPQHRVLQDAVLKRHQCRITPDERP